MKKIGVVLSGCGVYDGSEIHETVLTLLALSRQGADVICFAPDKTQADVINHLTGEPMAESRNVLIEAARIVRGDIHPLAQADAAELDALIVPGGFGAAKNLSTFATEGTACHVDPDLKALSLAMHAAGKPQGFICIAPAMLPKIFDFPLRSTPPAAAARQEHIYASARGRYPARSCPVAEYRAAPGHTRPA